MKKLCIFLSILLVAASVPTSVAATSDNLYTRYEVLHLPADQFTPEALLASELSNECGYYTDYAADMAWYLISDRTAIGSTIEVVLKGDSVRFSGMAKAVYSDGMVIDGVVERFTDGERITVIYPYRGAGVRAAVVISYRGVSGVQESTVTIVNNGYVFMRYTYEAGGWIGNSPYAPTPHTGTGSIEDIYYTNSDGDLCVRPNANLPGDNPIDPTEQPSDWAKSTVERAGGLGLLPETFRFGFRQPTTRAEYTAISVALYEHLRGEITGRSTFTDTTDINVEKAAFIGLVYGVGNNRFDPNSPLTREQAAVMLTRLSDLLGRPFPTRAPTFSDNSLIADWARSDVGRAQASGIVVGVGNNRFAPKDPYTREQAVVTIMRMYDRYMEAENG